MIPRYSTWLLLAALALAVPRAFGDDDNSVGGMFKKWGKSAVDNAQQAGSQELDSAKQKAKDTAKQRRSVDSAQIGRDVVTTGKALRKGFEDISDSEEYYIGRSVAAQILARYKPFADKKAAEYVQSVLQVVSLASDRPLIFKGYHAQILDSEEANAFAAPGGFVFVTTGLLKEVESEDELACVLAHEVAHVAAKHGLRAIKRSRLTAAFGLLAQQAAKDSGSEAAARLSEAFGGSVDDVVNQLVVSGYSRSQELESDKLGVGFARIANYNPGALERVLARLGSGAAAKWGFYKNHPGQKERVKDLKALALAPSSDFTDSKTRSTRFSAAMASLR